MEKHHVPHPELNLLVSFPRKDKKRNRRITLNCQKRARITAASTEVLVQCFRSLALAMTVLVQTLAGEKTCGKNAGWSDELH